jgi:general stress protein 26
MPGYGLLGPTEGRGLLPWSWAEARLARSHDYWVASVWPDGRPHLMPVWAVWHESSIWFSSSGRSRKTTNLRAEPRCTVATDDPLEPIVLDGIAEAVTDLGVLAVILELENAKYATNYGIELLDPELNTCFRVRPVGAFGLDQADFTGSPTHWDLR